GPIEIGYCVKQLRHAALATWLDDPIRPLLKVLFCDANRVLAPASDHEQDLIVLAHCFEVMWLVEETAVKDVIVDACHPHPNQPGLNRRDPGPAIVNQDLEIVGVFRMEPALKLWVILP